MASGAWETTEQKHNIHHGRKCVLNCVSDKGLKVKIYEKLNIIAKQKNKNYN